jgi:hypothetical protein
VGYDAEARVLEIEFDSGTVYQYLGVPESVYRELLAAPSKGSYFDGRIRYQYSHRQVG